MSAITSFPVPTRISGGALIASPSSALREQVAYRLNGRWLPVQHARGGFPAPEEEKTRHPFFVPESIECGSEGTQMQSEERSAEAHFYEPLPGMIGNSQAMQSIYRLVRLVSPRTTTLLVVGQTGSGKELVARALHALSPRSMKPFVAVNCAAIPEALLESELFGHAR